MAQDAPSSLKRPRQLKRAAEIVMAYGTEVATFLAGAADLVHLSSAPRIPPGTPYLHVVGPAGKMGKGKSATSGPAGPPHRYLIPADMVIKFEKKHFHIPPVDFPPEVITFLPGVPPESRVPLEHIQRVLNELQVRST